MVAALPGVLARRLAGMWPEETEAEISAPVRLRVPVRLAELQAIGTAAGSGATVGARGLAARVEALVEAALSASLSAAGVPARAQETAAAPETKAARVTAAAPGVEEMTELARLLVEWGAAGRLGFILDFLPASEMERWHAILQTSRAAGRASPELEHTLSELASRAVEERAPLPQRRSGCVRARIEIAVEVARLSRCAPDEPLLWRVLDQHVPLPASPAGGSERPNPSGAEASPQALAVEQDAATLPARESAENDRPVRAFGPRPISHTEVYTRHALPFLLLGPLERCGYLETVSACLESLGRKSEAGLFAAALAYKALPAPERGWRREQTAAGIFAGMEGGVPEPALVSFAAAMDTHVAPLRGVLVENLSRGHTPKAPLLLVPIAGVFVLFDPDALIPVDCAPTLPELFLTVQKFGAPLLVAPESASAIPLEALREAALPYALSPAVREREERAFAVWDELSVRRPCAPLASAPALDRAVTLAAASAMGTIAWGLWHEREPVDPLLLLQRFGDLDARVRFEEKTVRVRLPLGSRYLELYRHGFLDPVQRTPWLGGRVLEFSGG